MRGLVSVGIRGKQDRHRKGDLGESEQGDHLAGSEALDTFINAVSGLATDFNRPSRDVDDPVIRNPGAGIKAGFSTQVLREAAFGDFDE
jgi:hypothetical protein